MYKSRIFSIVPFLLSTSFLGCSSNLVALQVVQVPEPVVDSKPKPKHSVEELCEFQRKKNREAFDRLLEEPAKDDQGNIVEHPKYSKEWFNRFQVCEPSGQGVWVLDVVSTKITGHFYSEANSNVDDIADIEGSYVFSHRNLNGSIERIKEWVFYSYSARSGIQTYPAPMVSFDFDGDGTKEVWFDVYGMNDECNEEFHNTALYTLRNGKTVQYPNRPSSMEAMQDFDKDGRPDFLTNLPLGFFQVCSEGDPPGHFFNPPSVYHSLPDGTFSSEDEAVRKYYTSFFQEMCPSPPQSVTSNGKTNIHWRLSGDGPKDVLCARLWGIDKNVLEDQTNDMCPSQCDPDVMDETCLRFDTRMGCIGLIDQILTIEIPLNIQLKKP